MIFLYQFGIVKAMYIRKVKRTKLNRTMMTKIPVIPISSNIYPIVTNKPAIPIVNNRFDFGIESPRTFAEEIKKTIIGIKIGKAKNGKTKNSISSA